MSGPEPSLVSGTGSGLDLSLHATDPVPLELALRVGPLETLALVGRSGAGKTSVLKAIAGLLPGVGGHVRVDGESWLDAGASRPPHLRRVGFVFQSYALFPHMTAAENLTAAMDAPDRAAADALLAQVHLEGFADRRPDELSGGQQQRVALARALARHPRLLLLDEPFSATDRPTRRALAETIRELRATLPIPTVIVSHDLDDVAALASHIAILDAGRLVQHGPAADVIANPANALVRDLVA